MRLKQKLIELLGLGNKDQPTRAVEGQFTLKLSWEIAWAFTIGFVSFFLVYLNSNNDQVSLLQKSPTSSYLFLLPEFITFCSGGLFILMAGIFGKKNSTGIYQFANKHSWIKPVLYTMLILQFLALGFMGGAFLKSFFNITNY